MDIPSVYEQYGVILEAVGSRWRATCPFHVEQDPSFVVYPDGGYHCFGCQAHGTYKDFVEKMGGEIDNILVVGIEDMKDKNDLMDFQKLKLTLHDELLALLHRSGYAMKKKLWSSFDALWLNYAFFKEETLLESLLFIRSGFNKIISSVKSS